MENPLLAAYLRFLLTGRNQESQPSGTNFPEALDADRTSPLTLYLAWKGGRLETTADHVERHPGFAELLLYRGSRLLEEARYAEAIESMAEAIRLVPEYTKAMVTLGEFHLRSLHLYRRAFRYFEDALTRDPQNISALYGHGVVLHQLGVLNQSRPGRDILVNFMNNAFCRQRKLSNLTEELSRIENLDLDSTRKEEVLDVLRARRDRLREETYASLFNMTERVGSIDELDTTVFHQAMEKVWGRLSDPE